MESARHHRERVQKIEMEAEALFTQLQDHQTLIKKQANNCLKTGQRFKSQRKRI